MMGSTQPAIVSTFLSKLEADQGLPDEAVQLLDVSGARTPEGVLSLLQNFPSAAMAAGISSPKVSNYAMQNGGPALRAIVQNSPTGQILGQVRGPGPGSGYGALPPPLSLWQKDKNVPWSPTQSPPASASSSATGKLINTFALDTRGCLPWPVKDQGKRGTCVAFGTSALREQLLCQAGGIQNLSEQFLYWDIKTSSPDPHKHQDGTWIEFAFETLGRAGICLASLWTYNGVLNSANISQGSPGVPAPPIINAALRYAHRAPVYQRTPVANGSAQTIFNLLASAHRPVAISVPVFSDPLVPQTDNWSTNVGWYNGFVLDPPPTSIVSGGHCVCVTGFEPDPAEPMGGYFVIRNSWSGQWGSQLPAAGYAGPEPGYGQISASYVDQFLWEYGQL